MAKKSKSSSSKKPATPKSEKLENTQQVEDAVHVEVGAPDETVAEEITSKEIPIDSAGNSSVVDESATVPLEVDTPDLQTLQTLQAENSTLRAELDDLKRQMLEKDEEIERLKSQTSVKDEGLKGSNMEDLEVLQSRLAELKEQQQKADAQRDHAWSELRRVIEEVSSIADNSKVAIAAN